MATASMSHLFDFDGGDAVTIFDPLSMRGKFGAMRTAWFRRADIVKIVDLNISYHHASQLVGSVVLQTS